MSEHFGFDAEDPGEGFPGDDAHPWDAGDPGSHDLGHDPLPEGLDDGSDPYGFDHDPGGPGVADDGDVHGDLPDGGPAEGGFGPASPEGVDDPYGHDGSQSSPSHDGIQGSAGLDGFAGSPSHDGPDGSTAGDIPEHPGGHEAAALDLEPEPSSPDGDLSYPPPLDVDVAPTDGLDWVDPGLLGSETDAGPHFAMAAPDELLASVHSADGADGESTWEAMHASDDPATRALAAFWDPLNR